jgi:hypothetical protein
MQGAGTFDRSRAQLAPRIRSEADRMTDAALWFNPA